MRYPLYCFPLFFFLGGAVDIGWRCLLQPYLEKKMPFILSIVLVGIIWSVWHLPLFFIVGTTQYSETFIYFAISTTGLAFVLAVIYRLSGSVWLCILFHCATNSLQGTWPIGDDLFVNINQSIVLAALAIAIWLIHRRIAERDSVT
jgi:membrane protease YdiL (CAAX protease family)